MVSAARVYDSGKLVAIGTTPSSPDLTGISPWVFRMITSDSMNGVILAKFASSFKSELGRPVRAAVLYENDAYGRGLADAFERNFNGEIISIDPVGAGGDLEPYVAYYKLRKLDLIFVASTDNVGIPLLREARKQGLATTFLGGDGWQTVARDSASEGVYVGTPFTAQSQDTAAQRFIAAFRTKFGNLPDAHAALAYDATKLLAQAIAVVGPDRTKIRAYLSSLTDIQPFHGVEGPVLFTIKNDPASDNFHITRVHAGLLLPVAR
jgi:branched-chain amino acid transport system substrate-binding protein